MSPVEPDERTLGVKGNRAAFGSNIIISVVRRVFVNINDGMVDLRCQESRLVLREPGGGVDSLRLFHHLAILANNGEPQVRSSTSGASSKRIFRSNVTMRERPSTSKTHTPVLFAGRSMLRAPGAPSRASRKSSRFLASGQLTPPTGEPCSSRTASVRALASLAAAMIEAIASSRVSWSVSSSKSVAPDLETNEEPSSHCDTDHSIESPKGLNQPTVDGSLYSPVVQEVCDLNAR